MDKDAPITGYTYKMMMCDDFIANCDSFVKAAHQMKNNIVTTCSHE